MDYATDVIGASDGEGADGLCVVAIDWRFYLRGTFLFDGLYGAIHPGAVLNVMECGRVVDQC